MLRHLLSSALVLVWTSTALAQSPWKSVYQYGATCNGTADDTAAFNASINDQGSAYVPMGRCMVNLVITKSNVRIIGHTFTERAPINSSLRPYDPGKPVIQIGNDTGIVAGVRLDGVSLWGGSNRGTVGLSLAGGAYQNFFTGVAVAGFSDYGIRIEGGASYPASLNYFDGVNVEGTATQSAGIEIKYASGSYTSATFISNARISGTASGYALIVDGSDLHLSSSWVQAQNNHGLQIAANGGMSPHVYAEGFVIDSSGPSSDALVTMYKNDKVTSRYLHGTFMIDGVVVYPDKSTVSLTGTNPTLFSGRLDRQTIFRVGGGTTYGWTPIVLRSASGLVGNSGVVETTLKSYTLEAGVMNEDGQSVTCEAYGNFAANSNSKSVRLYVGSTVVAAVVGTASSGNGWQARWTMTRTGGSAATASGTIAYGSSSVTPAFSSWSPNFASTITFSVTGQSGTASNDVTAQQLSCVWLPQQGQ